MEWDVREEKEVSLLSRGNLQLSSQGLILHYGPFYKNFCLNILSHSELFLPKVVKSILDNSSCMEVL